MRIFALLGPIQGWSLKFSVGLLCLAVSPEERKTTLVWRHSAYPSPMDKTSENFKIPFLRVP